MGARYVEVPRAEMEAFLKSMGFVEQERSGNTFRQREVVYVRCHERDPRLVVHVYTSIAKQSTVARECGADAIRVALVGSTPGVMSVGMWKGKKILRTGSPAKVFERIRERAREAYQAANRALKAPRCRTCGFYSYWSAGSTVCANRKCETRGRLLWTPS